MDLCCPECEHDTFEQVRTARIKYTLKFDPDVGGWYKVAEETVDGGDMGDHEIVCADCGYEVEDDDLVTEIEDDWDELEFDLVDTYLND